MNQGDATVPGGITRRRLHGDLKRGKRLGGIAAIQQPQPLSPSSWHVVGRQCDDHFHVRECGIDLATPRTEQRLPVAPARLLPVQINRHRVVRGGLDEQAIGLEPHGEASPARGIRAVGVHGRRQLTEERRYRGIEVAEGARVGRHGSTTAACRD